jgi:hypothetical protein
LAQGGNLEQVLQLPIITEFAHMKELPIPQAPILIQEIIAKITSVFATVGAKNE